MYSGRSKDFLEEVPKNCRSWQHPVARHWSMMAKNCSRNRQNAFHGADADGSDCAIDRTERTRLQDRLCWWCAAKKLEASRKEYSQLCGFCTDI